MPPIPRRHAVTVTLLCALLCALLGVAGCADDDGPAVLTVYATSSLTEVFGELATAYRQQTGVRLDARFGGSFDMAAGVAARDPADVLVTADETALRTAERRLTGRRRAIATTGLTIAVAPGNPRRIRDLADLTRPDLRVVVGSKAVPVGRHTRQVLTRAGLRVRWRSEESGSRAVLDRVRAGHADAGLVYVTDLRSAGAAAGSVAIPAALNTVATFPAAVVRGDRERAATAFVDWLAGPAAAVLLHKYGYGSPARTG